MTNLLETEMQKLGYELVKRNPCTFFDKKSKFEISVDCGCISKWDTANCETVHFTNKEIEIIAKYNEF